MARYRKVDPRIWNDEKFRDLDDRGKLVFFFLLTHPHMTAIGAMRASIPGLASEIGWTEKAFREAFREPLSKGMAQHDEKASFMWLPNFLKYNPPESPNVVKAWASALELLPECALLTRVITSAKEFAEGLTEGFTKALPEPFAKSMPIQEQEQEQEQDIGADAQTRLPKRATQLPDKFELTEALKAFAEKNGVRDPQFEFNKFCEFHRSKGSTFKDWPAAFRTWAMNHKSFQSRGYPASASGYRPPKTSSLVESKI